MHPIPGSSTSFCVKGGVVDLLCDVPAAPAAAEGFGVLAPPLVDVLVDCMCVMLFLSKSRSQRAMPGLSGDSSSNNTTARAESISRREMREVVSRGGALASHEKRAKE